MWQEYQTKSFSHLMLNVLTTTDLLGTNSVQFILLLRDMVTDAFSLSL